MSRVDPPLVLFIWTELLLLALNCQEAVARVLVNRKAAGKVRAGFFAVIFTEVINGLNLTAAKSNFLRVQVVCNTLAICVLVGHSLYPSLLDLVMVPLPYLASFSLVNYVFQQMPTAYASVLAW